MTVLSEEDSILMDGMVGTSASNGICNTDDNCSKTGCGGSSSGGGSNNCYGGNCVVGCGAK